MHTHTHTHTHACTHTTNGHLLAFQSRLPWSLEWLHLLKSVIIRTKTKHCYFSLLCFYLCLLRWQNTLTCILVHNHASTEHCMLIKNVTYLHFLQILAISCNWCNDMCVRYLVTTVKRMFTRGKFSWIVSYTHTHWTNFLHSKLVQDKDTVIKYSSLYEVDINVYCITVVTHTHGHVQSTSFSLSKILLIQNVHI